MEVYMELNGVANLSLMVDHLKSEMHTISPMAISEMVTDMQQQLILLERYMIAYQAWSDRAIPAGALLVTNAPAWHEVKANPKKFPTNRERNG